MSRLLKWYKIQPPNVRKASMYKKLNYLAMVLSIAISVHMYGMEAVKQGNLLAPGTQHLLEAIKSRDFQKAKLAIETEGADVNFHFQVTNDDYSKTDWTPLMKAVAELAYLMVTSQSRLNGVMLWGSQVIKDEYRSDLLNLKQIIELLVSNPTIIKEYANEKGRTAAAICGHARNLLSAETLIPPYKTRTPEREYTETLASIEEKLGKAQRKLGLATGTPSFFRLNRTFAKIEGKLPIVFDPRYDISAYGIEKLHPFDAKKYGKVVRILQDKLKFSLTQFHAPTPVSDADLALVHTPGYIKSLSSSQTLGVLADMDSLGYLPNRFVQGVLLDPVKLATGGTILATQLALKHGWAINISGGYHHAKSQELVRGFCIINDLCIAAKKVIMEDTQARVLIVDLDAHQGNGHEEIAQSEKRIAIFDMYNADTWPGDYPCQERINFDYPLNAKTKDGDYMTLLNQELPKAIDTVKPTLIIYNAGTDIYEHDPLGMLSITRKAIIDRDLYVFSEAWKRNIPIVMVLSGGYHADSYSIIGESITNLWNKLLITGITSP